MHYITSVALATLAAIGVSALPLDGRGLVTADGITHSADDLVKRNSYALPITHDKKYYGRQILSSRAAESSVVPDSVHVLSPVSKYVKRVTQEPDPPVKLPTVALPSISGGGQAIVDVGETNDINYPEDSLV